MDFNSIQSYPILLTAIFFIFNFMVSWVLYQLIRRGTGRNSSSTSTREYSSLSIIERQRTRRILSACALLYDCLFSPLSINTGQRLIDYGLDDSFIFPIERLLLPNLWLSPTVPSDYAKYLPVWQYNRNTLKSSRLEAPAPLFSASRYTNSDAVNRCNNNLNQPWNSEFSLFNMAWISTTDCSICLDKYRFSVYVCGLPCGHLFHQECIMVWLQRDNHNCPMCRWPAYKNKPLSGIIWCPFLTF